MFNRIKKMLKEREKQSKMNIQNRIEAEKDQARKFTKEGKVKEAAVQWDIVEELSAEAADQSAYEKFCEENPSDHNCKMYDV